MPLLLVLVMLHAGQKGLETHLIDGKAPETQKQSIHQLQRGSHNSNTCKAKVNTHRQLVSTYMSEGVFLMHIAAAVFVSTYTTHMHHALPDCAGLWGPNCHDTTHNITHPQDKKVVLLLSCQSSRPSNRRRKQPDVPTGPSCARHPR